MNFSRHAGARPRGPRTALVLVLAPIAMPAQAEVSRLEPVTVSVTRVEKAIEDVPAAVGAVGADEIQLGAEQLGLDESLDRIPGLFFLNRYNFAQDLRASIRGFGARANFGIRGIRIIVDGIPETLPDGQGSVDGIDLGSARQVSVIRGPASSLYGNASGGAIIVESERGPSVPFAELRAAAGRYDYEKYQVKAGGETGRLNYLVNVSDTTLDGYRDHSESENSQLNGRFEFALSDASRLLLTAHHTDQPVANDPGALTEEEVAADRTAARPLNVQFRAGEVLDQTRAGVLYETQVSDATTVEARVYRTDRDFSNTLPFRDGGAVTLDRAFTGGGFKITRDHDSLGRDNQLLVGIDYDRQDDDRRRFDNIDGVRGPLDADQNELVTAVGAYAQNEMALGERIDLTLGVRYDEVEFDVTDRFLADGDDSGKVTFDEFSPMAGIGYQASEATRLYANVSTAFETPTTTEFANPAGGGFNQALDSQVSTNYEIGIKSRGDRYRFDVALFHIDVDDELTPFELPGQSGRSFFENAGSSSRDGVEIALTRELGAGMELSAAYTWSDFTFDRFRDVDGAVHDGNRIPGIPEHLFHVEWSWFGASGLYAIVDATYTGSFFADNANRDEVDSYTVSSMRAGYNGYFGGWEISPFLGVNNLFDEEYNGNIRINAFGARYFEPAPERNLYMGLTIRKNFDE